MPSSTSVARESLAQRRDLHLAAFIAVLISALHVAWLWRDRNLMPGIDPYFYLSHLLRFLDRENFGSLTELWASLDLLAVRGRPPLYQLLTMPFILWFGESTDAALSINVVFTFALVLATFALGLAAKSPGTGLLAGFLVATYPPVVHLSRAFRPHYALPACVAFSLWLLLLLVRKPGVRVAWGFIASLAFGFLIHPHFILAMSVPTIVAGGYLVFFRDPPRWPAGIRSLPAWTLQKLSAPVVLRGLIPATLLFLVPALVWYAYQAPTLLDVITGWRALYPQGLTFGFKEVGGHSFWWYLRTAPGALSNVLFAFAVLGFGYCLIRGSWPLRLLCLAAAAGYVAFSGEPTLAWWKIVSLLPIVATLTAAWVHSLPRRWLRLAGVAICVSVASFNFHLVGWGVGSWSRPAALALGAPLGTWTCEHLGADTCQLTCQHEVTAAFCPRPPGVVAWPYRDILEATLSDPACRDKRCVMVVPRGHSARLAYYRSREWPDARLPIGQLFFKNPTVGLPGIRLLLKHDIFLASSVDPEELLSLVLDVPVKGNYQEIAAFRALNGDEWRLMKRVKPVTSPEINAPEEVLLANYYRENRQLAQSFELYRQALAAEPDQVDGRIGLAKAYAKDGQADLAVGELKRAIDLAPRNERPRRVLAAIYRQQGMLDRATALSEGLEQEPGDSAGRPVRGDGRGS